VPASLYAERSGLPLESILPQLERLRRDGLLSADPDRIAPTRRGLDFLSDVQEAFL
jgi:oxygen-independent coproporphyrinogen-3 oxidase